MIKLTATAANAADALPDGLPQGWAVCRVGEVFRSFGGGTPNKGTPAFWGGAIPWLSSGDIKADRVGAGSESITPSGLQNSSANLCRTGSVLVVVRSGVLKHTLPVAVLETEAAINQDIKCFDSGQKELNEWLALALRAAAEDILTLNREGTTVQSVKYETLKDFELPLPPSASSGGSWPNWRNCWAKWVPARSAWPRSPSSSNASASPSSPPPAPAASPPTGGKRTRM
jgi:hypothetical protein